MQKCADYPHGQSAPIKMNIYRVSKEPIYFVMALSSALMRFAVSPLQVDAFERK